MKTGVATNLGSWTGSSPVSCVGPDATEYHMGDPGIVEGLAEGRPAVVLRPSEKHLRQREKAKREGEGEGKARGKAEGEGEADRKRDAEVHSRPERGEDAGKSHDREAKAWGAAGCRSWLLKRIFASLC